MPIRPYQSGDAAALFEVFQTAIHQTAAADYSPAQINAWAPPDRDPQAWQARMDAIAPFVFADAQGRIVAYASLDAHGYIDHFFVHGDYARQGLGNALMAHILQCAEQLQLPLLSADVSRTAQPFFARHGFVVVEERTPVRFGVAIPNALMHKSLHAVSALAHWG